MEFFNEVWSNRLIDQTELFKEMPPTMASTVSEFLYRLRQINIEIVFEKILK